MVSIGTPFTDGAMRVMLCGSGELGKEVAIELQRYGVEVIAVDSYANAPAMQVADRSHVVSMLDGTALRAVIEAEKPHLIVPEVEAIRTEVLKDFEDHGQKIVPSARAASFTRAISTASCAARSALTFRPRSCAPSRLTACGSMFFGMLWSPLRIFGWVVQG